jgi:anti-sigma regulatory factor (Ser/Thr protein kinase)
MIQMDPSRPADGGFVTVTVPSQAESIRPAASFLVQAAKNMRVPPASDSGFELAIVEALNNAVKHGNTGQPGAVIVCELERADHSVTIRILDQGPGFELHVLPPRPESRRADVSSIPESGYGLSIIQSVFPTMRTFSRTGKFGLEMSLTF